MTTKLQLYNNVLNTCGERGQSSTGGILATTLNSSVQEAIYSVCNGNAWNELRSVINATTWVTDLATLPNTVTRVRNVYFYLSPTGLPEATYDHPTVSVPFVDLETYLTIPLVPFIGAENAPQGFTIQSVNSVRVNPYPSDTLSRSKVKFEVYNTVTIPVADTDSFTCSDLLLNLIQWKASEIFCLKHLNDVQTAQVIMLTYENFRKQHMISDSGQPTAGYSMFRRRRGR